MNQNISNLLAAIVISIAIIFGWHFFYEKPRIQRLAEETREYKEQLAKLKEDSKKNTALISKTEDIKDNTKRVQIRTEALSGSISLKGLRLDDLTLMRYKQDLTEDSPPVTLFSSSNSTSPYFAEFGWWKTKESDSVPDLQTIWESDGDILSLEQPLTFRWKNNNKVEFVVKIEVDENYLFTITQTTHNRSANNIEFKHYGIINLAYQEQEEKAIGILHQGPIASINGELQETSFSKIKDEKKQQFINAEINWLGITDKYWLTAFVPDAKEHYSANYLYAFRSGQERYQADFLSSQTHLLSPNSSFSLSHKLFAGAKKLDLLDQYEAQYGIKLFDRTVDFGWFYVLTKPIFYALNFFYKYVGNFGLSIMIVTIIIKLSMFSLANKSFRSMKAMKKLQPEMERIKALYSTDQIKLNQEMMSLYKRENVNPLSGCLPIIVQIPVFFSIYKVLYVTIETRHAPFFGWIKDLSVADPTSIFNLFGLLPFQPPSFLMIGAWPIIMAITMYLQQRMTPAPADQVQAQIMRFMPLIFLFMFGSFPVGLLIYWSWNNLLSIIQQLYINKLDK